MSSLQKQSLMVFLFALSCNLCLSQDNPTEPSFMKAAIITGESIGSEYRAENRSFQGIPSIQVGKDERLWAVWFGGGGTHQSPISSVEYKFESKD